MTKVTHLTTDEHGGLNRRRIHLREISGDADLPLETVGQDLRAARLRRGDDLAAVSRALKIRKDHLEAIEEDHVEALPGRTYAIGFVRSYADFLGLDAVQAVERFKAEIAGRGEPRHQIALSAEDDERQLPHGWIVIAVVLLAIVSYGAYQLARSADSLLRQPVAPVPARIAAEPSTPKAVPSLPKVIQAPAAASALAAQPVAGAQSGQAGTGAAAAGPGAPSGPTAAPAGAPAGPGMGSQPSPQVTPQVAALPPGKEFGALNKDSRVTLRVRAVTRVLVQGADGAVYLNRILHPGDTYRVPDKVGLTLTAPDGGAVGLELDGQAMGTAGASGQVTEALSLDPQAVVDRYNGGGPR